MPGRARLLAAWLVVCLALFGAGPAGGAGRTTLTFLSWKPAIPGPWRRLIHRFEAGHPGIRVRLQLGPQSSTAFHAIVSQRLKNRDPSVDVFFMDVTWPAELASAGWLLDLSSRFPAAEQSRFLPGPISANRYRGRIYGVPSFVDAGLLFYRKDLLEKYGFGPPATWEQMLAQGKAILRSEQDPNLHIYSAQFKQYEGLVCDMLEFIWSNCGAVLEGGGGRVLLAESAALEAVAFVRDRIIGRAAPRGVLSYEEPESLALFLQGRAIFHRNWPYAWRLANDPQKSRVAGRVAVAALPAFEGCRPAATLGGWQLGISRWSRQPQAAWEFVRFFTSYQSQKLLALEAGRAPSRKALYQDAELLQRLPHLVSFLPAFRAARPRPLSPLYPLISQVLQRFFSRAISEPGSDIPALAQQASQEIRSLEELARSGRP